MSPPVRLETVLRHDRAIVLSALAGIAVVAWFSMLNEARAMHDTGACHCLGMAMSGPDVRPWAISALIPLFLMWAGMMVAMMIPSAVPMILTFAMVNRRRREQERPFVPAGLFLLGYLIVWSGFSLAAGLAQWALHGATLLSPMMESASPLLGGALLTGAGIFQWTPWKNTCLHQCRTPLHFLLTSWREGRMGAMSMGVKHGAYCTGCCWLLMAVLFVTGVMNMTWVALLSILVLLEKMMPHGEILGRLAGLLLACWGVWMMAMP